MKLASRGGAPFVLGRRFLAERMHPAVDVGVGVLVVVRQRVDHLPRFLRGRRVVQIDERHPVDAALQDREVGANGLDVETDNLVRG